MERITSDLYFFITNTPIYVSFFTLLISILYVVSERNLSKVLKANKQLHNQNLVFTERNKDLEKDNSNLQAQIELLIQSMGKLADEYNELKKSINQ